MKIALIIVFIVFFIFLVLSIISYNIFCSFLKRENKERGYYANSEPWKSIFENLMVEKEWFFSKLYERLQIINEGYKLNGYYLSQESENTVIILHGWKDDAIIRMDSVRLYYDMGFNVFLPDIRSHGKSEGKYIGLGCVDQGDVIKWIEFLQEKEKHNCTFVLDGFSMGGVTALALSGNTNLPKSVKAIISEGAFTSIKELLPTKLKINLPILKYIMFFLVEACSKIFAGYGFNENSPEQMIQKSNIPTLIIHGVNDDFVPLYMSKKLFSLCSSEKEYFVSEIGAHGTIAWHEKEVYQEKIKTFLKKYLNLRS